MRYVVLFLLTGLFVGLSGCEERFRYFCQDPKNWQEKRCQRPDCQFTQDCPDYLVAPVLEKQIVQQAPAQPPRLLTVEEIEVRVWATVVIIVTIILAGIVGFMLYSLAFVTQPVKTMAPMDQAFAKMLNDIVLLIVGGIGGVMSKKGVQAISERIASNQTPPPSPQPQAVAPSTGPAPTASSGLFSFDFEGFKNPELDESWRPPPPPTTPANYVDPSKEDIAIERELAKREAT